MGEVTGGDGETTGVFVGEDDADGDCVTAGALEHAVGVIKAAATIKTIASLTYLMSKDFMGHLQ
jgi:hypothetical protein